MVAMAPGGDGDNGLTLVELLIATSMVAVVGGVGAASLGSLKVDAVAAACATDLHVVKTAATAYFTTTGEYPASIADLTRAEFLSAPSRVADYTFDVAAHDVTQVCHAVEDISPSGP